MKILASDMTLTVDRNGIVTLQYDSLFLPSAARTAMNGATPGRSLALSLTLKPSIGLPNARHDLTEDPAL